MLVQDGLCIGLILPCRAAEQGLEAVAAFPVHDHQVLQGGQLGLNALDHLFEVKAAEHPGRNDDPCLAVPEHEIQLALAKDVHERVDDGANA